MGWIEKKEVIVNWISGFKYGEWILNKYIHSALIFLGFVILAWFVRHIYRNVFFRIAKKTETQVDDMIFKSTKWPLYFIILLIGVKVATLPLQLSTNYVNFINNFVQSIIYIIIAFIATSITNILVDSWGKKFTERTESKIDDQLLVIAHRFFKILYILLALLFILQLWGVQIAPLLASLGIAGIAIGFAVKDTLANIFGGIQLIIDKTFKVGDKIELNDGTLGVIKDISLRSTRVRTYDNELIIIPNGILANEPIKNHVQPELKQRVVVPFSVEYGSDVDRVKKVVLNVIRKVENFMEDPEPSVMFMEMADFSLNFKAFFWVPSYEYAFAAKEQANCLIYKTLNKESIGIPFPTRTIYIKEEGKKTGKK